MPITPITYASPAETRAQLDDLLLETFGLSLAGWHARGHWTADYTCYALIEDGRALANAGVYRMEMLVRGERQVWLQIGAVATRKARRGEGLSRRILEEIFANSPHTPFCLFANDSVVDFYPRFGFRRLPDRQPSLPFRLDNSTSEMRRLLISDPAVGKYLDGRAGFSSLLDCANAAPVNWFHLLGEYGDCIYEIPALQVLLVARQQGETLSLKDVVAKRAVTFTGLAAHLGFSGVRAIRFGFNPDWLGVDYEMAETEEDDATPIFFKGELTLAETGKWMLPLMMRT